MCVEDNPHQSAVGAEGNFGTVARRLDSSDGSLAIADPTSEGGVRTFSRQRPEARETIVDECAATQGPPRQRLGDVAVAVAAEGIHQCPTLPPRITEPHRSPFDPRLGQKPRYLGSSCSRPEPIDVIAGACRTPIII